MGVITPLLFSVGCVPGALRALAPYGLWSGWALLPRALLAPRFVAAERRVAAELNGSEGKNRRRSELIPALRLLWVVLPKLPDGWEVLVRLATPEVVVSRRWNPHGPFRWEQVALGQCGIVIGTRESRFWAVGLAMPGVGMP